MIEVLRRQFEPDMTIDEKTNRVREFLQIVCLKIMYDKNFFERFAFIGGTALRVLYDLRRFSEDLDFSLTDKKGYSFLEIHSTLVREFKLYGLSAEGRPKDSATVHSGFLKFAGLLKQLGLSNLKNQNLSIKIEVDSNPHAGWRTESTVINKTYLFSINHFDLPSLYATKVHACFFRRYVKGRDFYDFIWYLGRKTRPNFELLNNAIRQTEGGDSRLGDDNFKDFLLKRIEKIDFEKAKADVERFLEDKGELKLFNLKSIRETIGSVYSV